MFLGLRLFLCRLLIGRDSYLIEKEVQKTYEEIWPKHDYYKARTLNSLRLLAMKFYLRQIEV